MIEETKEFNEIYQEEYDVIVQGTGIRECILSGQQSQNKYKVQNIDEDTYYGGESASLSLDTLFEKYPKQFENIDIKEFGNPKHWCIDQCPKFQMGCGKLVKMLIKSQVTRYIEFSSIDGSFVYQNKKIHKVPSTVLEAGTSSLLGFFEKAHFKSFLKFVTGYDKNNEKHIKDFDANNKTIYEQFQYFKLSDNTMDFVTHCIAQYDSNKCYNQKAIELIERCKQYGLSLARFQKSAFIYPHYGIGSIPEGFARLCAVNGGTQMLGQPIKNFVYNDDGKVCGLVLQSDERIIKTKCIIAQPNYLLKEKPSKVCIKNKIIRCIVIYDTIIDNTNNSRSCQIILPSKQIQREHDIYIAIVSNTLHVTPRNSKYTIAVISTIQEKSSDDITSLQLEIQSALNILKPYITMCIWTSNYYVPTDDGTDDNIFVTSSLDPTSHFEFATQEVLDIYPRITKSPLELLGEMDLDDQ